MPASSRNRPQPVTRDSKLIRTIADVGCALGTRGVTAEHHWRVNIPGSPQSDETQRGYWFPRVRERGRGSDGVNQHGRPDKMSVAPQRMSSRRCRGIFEAAAVGVPDRKAGETVKLLLLVPKDPIVSEADMPEYCK